MYTDSLGDIVVYSFQEVWASFITFVPVIIAAVLVFIIGLICAHILGKTVTNALRFLKLDDTLVAVGFGELGNKLGIKIEASRWIGVTAQWFVGTIFFITAMSALGLDQVTYFLQDIMYNYIPHVVQAILILALAFVTGEIVRKFVTRTAQVSKISSGPLLGSLAEWAIWAFAGFAALGEIGVAPEYVHTLFTGVVVALALALGLSFGLGGQEVAAEYLARVRREIQK
ncbi:MAG: hypothetical protein WAX38_00050 [Minisyncoccia bacterium]